MRVLRLMIQGRLKVSALRYLGTNCHELEDCLLLGDFDLIQLGIAEPCLFPDLRNLDLYHPIHYGNTRRENLVDVLSHHMPQLREFDTGEYREVDQYILEGLSKAREESIVRF